MSSTNAIDAPAQPPLRTWSLAARLTAWYALTSFLLLLAASGFLYWALVTNLDREDDLFLTGKLQVIEQLLRDRPGDVDTLRQSVKWQATARQQGQIHIRIVDHKDAVVLETPGMEVGLPRNIVPMPERTKAAAPRSGEIDGPTGDSFRYFTAWLANANGQGDAWQAQLALDRTFEEGLLARYRRNLGFALAVGLVVCTIAGYQIARRGLRPLRAITAAAQRIRAATLNERLQLAGMPAELAALGATFNEMLSRLEDAFQRLARFSADIAHELRTPVNNLRGEIEVTIGRERRGEEYREVLSSCLEECGRLARLIDTLLFLARAESPQMQITRQELHLATELNTVREFYEPAAQEGGVTLHVECDPMVAAIVDRTLLQRAISNLVANALAHTPPGGTVTLRAFQDQTGTHIEVADTGAGIPKEHLPFVFDRFYRADAARAGDGGRVGLGLALVKSIMILHGGEATITSHLGKGTTVELILPIQAS